ncbi:MAG: MerR family transcriptional regulator [Cyanobacteria bacterium P01_H01_bin.74]
MSTALSTENFPYTIDYVLSLLGLNQKELQTLSQLLNVVAKQDPKTEKPIYTHNDIDRLRRALEMSRQGISKSEIVRHLAYPPDTLVSSPSEGLQNGISASSISKKQAVSAEGAYTDRTTFMIEAVDQVKQSILNDLSRLLDDKLSGLDEVVVELIRCKSENDALKKKMAATAEENETLSKELSRFKPFQFGLYRKT